MKYALYISLIVIGLSSCTEKSQEADAYGHFEAKEFFITSEISGKLVKADFTQGDIVGEGDTIAAIDANSLQVQLDGFVARESAISSKIAVLESQRDVLKIEIQGLQKEYERLANLKNKGAATIQQFDSVENKLLSAKARLKTFDPQIKSVYKELAVLDSERDVLLDKMSKAVIVALVGGTVVEKYLEIGEMAIPGKPIAKLASMDDMYLRAYISGSQLSSFKIGEKVEIRIDGPDDTYKSFPGIVSWVAEKAEFTPKIIQTKEERVNLVYAIKVKVKNEGEIKIGMPGELIKL
jgi:HlyD family secretion protein